MRLPRRFASWLKLLAMSVIASDRRERGNLKKPLPTLVWLLLAIFIVRAFIYASFTPPWQGPDEPLHYDYIHYLQTEKKLPVVGETVLCRKVNSSLNTFYFNLYKKQQSPYDFEQKLSIKESYRNKIYHPQKGRQNQIVQHPPLYYLIGAVITYPFRGSSLLTSIWLLRMLSAVFGLGVVILTFLTVNLIFEDRWPAIAAAAFVAVNPMFTHITTLVSNDSLLNLLFAAFLFILIKSIKEGLTTKRSVFLGLIIGLGMLTKFFFVLAFPISIAAFLLFGKQTKLGIKRALIVLMGPVALSGIYYLRNIKLYGVLQPSVKVIKAQGTFTAVSLARHVYLFGQKALISFWSNFGWQYPRFGRVWQMLIFDVVFLSLIGLIVFLATIDKKRSSFEFKITTLLLSAVFLQAVVLAFYSYKEFSQTGLVSGIQGRYFFLFIGPLGMFFYLGIRRLVPFLKSKTVFLAFLGFMAMLDISAVFYYILPRFYAINGPVVYVAIKASERAAQDWFRLGFLYLASLITYVLLIAGLLGATAYEKVKET